MAVFNYNTRFAPVCPIQVLEGMLAAGTDVFGDYHLLLAHHTVEHKKRFADLFKRATDLGWKGDVIMDNSIVELGDAVSLDMVAEATNVVKDNAPDSYCYPVLPDVMGKGRETRDIIGEQYSLWESGCPGDGFMAVCQGEDIEDYQKSLYMFADQMRFPEIRILGIPRILHKTCGSRIEAVRHVKDFLGTHLVHLLGFSDDMEDDLAALSFLGLGGIDSAVPLRVREVFTIHTDAGKRSPTWFEDALVDPLMLENLATARNIFEIKD